MIGQRGSNGYGTYRAMDQNILHEQVKQCKLNKNLADLITYNIIDCASLSELYHKVEKIFTEK
jgi:hypothetical protein